MHHDAFFVSPVNRRPIRHLLVYFAIALPLVFSGCATGVYKSGKMSDNGEPAYITVQHCLISFRDVPDIGATRSMEEAEALANEILEDARNGEDFGRLVKKYTNDSPPGIYRMANRGHESDMSSVVPSQKVFARDGMVPAFGNVGFKLKVGEFGLAPFDTETSPYGWHIIQRID